MAHVFLNSLQDLFVYLNCNVLERLNLENTELHGDLARIFNLSYQNRNMIYVNYTLYDCLEEILILQIKCQTLFAALSYKYFPKFF